MNNIELITKYSPKAWDTVYKQEAVTSVLDSNEVAVEFTGAKTVRIGKWQNGGLNNYYRNNNTLELGDQRVKPGDYPAAQALGANAFAGAADFGYRKSAARFVWEEFTLKQDRAAAFEIEYFDNEESGGELVGLGVKEISRTAIIPEVDAYTLSTIASYVPAAAQEAKTYGTPASDTPIADLNKAFLYFAEKEVPAEDQVIFASPKFMNALRNTTEVTKFLGQSDFTEGKDIKFEITKYQGRTIIMVSPERLRSDIVMYDGGYSWASTSKEINFLAVAKSAVMHIVKYEKVKIISGEANLAARGFDGYTVFARVYHDVFVPDNKRVALYLNYDNAGTGTPSIPLDITVAGGKITKIEGLPLDKLYFVGKDSTASAKAVGETILAANFTPVKVGDAISASTNFCAVDSNYRVVAVDTYTAG